MTDDEVFESNLQHFTISKRYVNKVQCKCPAHNDKQASLTITKGKKCILFYCHAGCTLENILLAAGLEKKDTFYDTEFRRTDWKAYVESREKRKIEAVYHYVSCNGQYAFTKVRLEGKKLLYGILKNERFSYGLPRSTPRKSLKATYGSVQALNKAISEGKPIFIVEGEKDTDTLTKQGYTSFTYGGVNDWQADFAELVKGADVIILADNDQPGKLVADTILQDILPVVKTAKIIVPMPEIPKADITDYFQAGHTKQEFEQMINAVTENRMECDIEPQEQIDLMQFHLVGDNGKITGAYHNAIFEYIKSKYNILVCGSTPYIYDQGYYKVDISGARLKSIIRQLIYPQFIKSTTINNIYALFLQDIELETDFEELNQYPETYINFQDCMLDVATMKEIPHSPDFYAINQLPFKWRKIKATKEGMEIEKFFDFIFISSDDRKMVLEYVGLCFTKDTRQQRFLTLCGLGGTGKSILIRLIETATGRENISNVSLQELSKRFSTSLLVGKLLNSCADLSAEMLEDSSIMKKLLGEDLLFAERKGEQGFMYRNYSKLLFSTNSLPIIAGERTNGFYRRLMIFRMDKQPEKVDTELFAKLSAELLYFIKLAIEALHEMYMRGGHITISEGSKEAVRQMWKDSDVVQAWLDDCCTLDSEAKTDRATAFSDFEKYCENEERQAMSRNGFYKALRNKNFAEIKLHGYSHIKGLKLRKETSLKNLPQTTPDGFIEVSQEELDSVSFT